MDSVVEPEPVKIRRLRIRVIKKSGVGIQMEIYESGFRIYLVPVTYTVNVQKHAMAKNLIFSFLSYIRYGTV